MTKPYDPNNPPDPSIPAYGDKNQDVSGTPDPYDPNNLHIMYADENIYPTGIPRLPDWIPPADIVNDMAEASRAEQTVASPTNPIPIIYGQVKTEGKIVVVHVDSDNGFLYTAFEFCESADSIDYVYVDGVDYYNATEGLGAVEGADIELHPTGGTSTILAAAISGYTDSPTVCYIVLKIPLAYGRGFPKVEAIIKGEAVYDPRTTNTVWSTNPALCFADLCDKAGWPINEASVIAAANWCDEIVGATKRHTLNLNVAKPKRLAEWAKVFRIYTGCFIVWEDGELKLIKDEAATLPGDVAMAITDDDIVKDSLVIKRRPPRSAPTTVIVEYSHQPSVDPDNWGTQRAVAEDVSYTTQRVQKIDLPGIATYQEAIREANSRLAKYASELTVELTLFDEAVELQVGSIVTVTHSLGLSADTFRVMRIDQATSRWKLYLMEYDAAMYPTVDPSDIIYYPSSYGSPGDPVATPPTVIGDDTWNIGDITTINPDGTESIVVVDGDVLRRVDLSALCNICLNGIDDPTIFVAEAPKVCASAVANPPEALSFDYVPSTDTPSARAGHFVFNVLFLQRNTLNGDVTISRPSGWTVIHPGPGNVYMDISYKFLTEADLTATHTFNASGTSWTKACIKQFVFKGISTTNPIYTSTYDYLNNSYNGAVETQLTNCVPVLANGQHIMCFTKFQSGAAGITEFDDCYGDTTGDITPDSVTKNHFDYYNGDRMGQSHQVAIWPANIYDDENLIPGETYTNTMNPNSFSTTQEFSGAMIPSSGSAKPKLLSLVDTGGNPIAYGYHAVERQQSLTAGEWATLWVRQGWHSTGYGTYSKNFHIYVVDPSSNERGIFLEQRTSGIQLKEYAGTAKDPQSDRGTVWHAGTWYGDNDGQPSIDGGWVYLMIQAPTTGTYKFRFGPGPGNTTLDFQFSVDNAAGNPDQYINIYDVQLRKGKRAARFVDTTNSAVSGVAQTGLNDTYGWLDAGHYDGKQLTLVLNPEWVRYPPGGMKAITDTGHASIQIEDAGDDGEKVSWTQYTGDDCIGPTLGDRYVFPEYEGADGKYYFEVELGANTSNWYPNVFFGCSYVYTLPSTHVHGSFSSTSGLGPVMDVWADNGGQSGGQGLAGDVWGIQVDYSTSEVRFYKNGSGTANHTESFDGTQPLRILVQVGAVGQQIPLYVRIREPFTYSIPTGFVRFDHQGDVNLNYGDSPISSGGGADIIATTDPVTYRTLYGVDGVQVTEQTETIEIGLNFDALNTTTFDADEDYFAYYDFSAALHRRALLADLPIAEEAPSDSVLYARYNSTWSALTDPYWDLVGALLHFEGTDASTTFDDETGKTWTASANAQIDTAQQKFGASSGLFDGSLDYVDSEASADFTFGTGDFTVEFQLRPAAVASTVCFFDLRPVSTQGLYPTIYSTGSDIRYYTDSADRITSAASTLVVDTWHHIALCRASGTTRLFVDGAIVGTAYTDTNDYVGTRIRIGASGVDASIGFSGHIDELRVTKYARYTTAFTPPTEAFVSTDVVGGGAGGASPTTTEGDLIVRGTSADDRLAIGSANTVLTSNGTTAVWSSASTGAVGESARSARVTKSSTQSCTGSASTTINWDDEQFDTGGMWASGNPSRMTAPADGKYLVTASTRLVGGGGHETSFILNGSTTTRYGNDRGNVTSPACVLDLTEGDYVEVRIYNEGATANFQTSEQLQFFAMVELINGKAFSGAKVSMSSPSQSIANTTDTALTDWDTEGFDTGAYWSAGTPSRFTVSEPGKYLVGANIKWPSTGMGNQAQLYFKVNGGTADTYGRVLHSAPNDHMSQTTALIELEADDYVEAMAWHNSGAARTLVTSGEQSFWIQNLGDATTVSNVIEPVQGGTSKLASSMVITSNATYADSALTLALEPGTYAVHVFLETTVATTPGMSVKLAFTGTYSNAAFQRTAVRTTTGGFAQYADLPEYSMTVADDHAVVLTGTITVTAAGNLKVQAKQNTSSGTSVTLHAGSWMAIDGGGSSTPIFSGARVHHSTTQTVSSTGTVIAWDSEAYDTDSYHSTSTNNSRLTAPSDGYYRIGWSVQPTAQGYQSIQIKKNGGASISDYAKGLLVGASSRYQSSIELQLSAGDYLELVVVNTANGSLTASADLNFFSISRMGV